MLVARFTMSNSDTLSEIISDNKAYSANTNGRVANFMKKMYRGLITFRDGSCDCDS